MTRGWTAALLLLAGPAVAAPPRIAVVDFDTNQWAGQMSGRQLADYVTDELVNTDLFEVIEREKLGSMTDEVRLGQTAAIDPTQAVRMGKMFGARYILTGRVIAIEHGKKSFSGYGIDTVSDVYSISVSIRITDAETGSVKFSTRTATENTVTQMASSRSSTSNPYTGLSEKAAVDMVKAIVDSGKFPAGAGAAEAPAAAVVMAKVTFASTPRDADVEVDGVAYGNTGGALQVPSGLRRVRISLPGYQAWEKQVMLSDGARFTATLVPRDLPPPPAAAPPPPPPRREGTTIIVR